MTHGWKSESFDAYLFVHFIHQDIGSSNSEQVYFSVSKDGIKWRTLNNKKPVLTSMLGDKGVRDPFIIRSPKEGKFYIIGTDLSMHYRKDWDEVQRSGSQHIVVWESSDLIEWSKQRLVNVGPETAGCVWAPEAIYDKEYDDFLVFWASRERFGAEKQRIYYAKTNDFKEFTKPEIYIERQNDVIDTTIIEEDGVYYRFSKDETVKSITMERSDSLLGEFQEIETNLNQVVGVEGPACFKLKNEDKWCLLLDHYAVEKKYFPYYTNDLNTGQFTKKEEGLDIPVHSKHGGVMTITRDEYDALVKKYGL
ncbi:glycoside hydrolase family 43 protein [Halalkalibacter hemicellulosilyticus]|uniref:Endo-1,4-beta-xylanase n=1 Tax=Halalkalibacter hemicellulosilyticusJCM 9152 TaxID=1236971 RepID=W4QF08_9BACI|nr:glycoside hydrolase family 43 protein [Halalkalibacter hemicellulosilyticus]GAE30248.1 endo-1,4-beta-xylanase [Halalkalibacter hemicellulosilyticusJCM 9152]